MSDKASRPLELGLTLFYTTMVLVFYQLINYAVLKHFIDNHPENNGSKSFKELLDLLIYDATTVSIGGILGACGALLFLVLITRFRKIDVKKHLKLQSFKTRDLFNWLLVLVGFSVIFTLIAWMISHPTSEFMQTIWQSRQHTILLLIAILIAAPVFEECLFRGFLFSGVQNSQLGTGAAIVISSAFWAIIHTQYGSFELITIFILGIVLAMSRVASGSLYVPILLHATNNLFAVLEMALFTKNVAQ